MAFAFTDTYFSVRKVCFAVSIKDWYAFLCCYAPLCDECYAHVVRAIKHAVVTRRGCREMELKCPSCKQYNVSVFDCMRDCLANDRVFVLKK